MKETADSLRQFKVAHQSILETIDQIQQSVRFYNQVKPHIRILEDQLLVYFGKQDENLYGPLIVHYAANREATKMIEFLRLDLRDLKIKLLIFFDQHSGEMGDQHARNFPKDFMEFAAAVIGRMRIEEDYLFPLLQNFPK